MSDGTPGNGGAAEAAGVSRRDRHRRDVYRSGRLRSVHPENAHDLQNALGARVSPVRRCSTPMQAADICHGRHRRARPWHDGCHQCPDRAHRRRVVLLVTAGHEDIPYIQRINRKTLYDLRWQKPRPLLAIAAATASACRSESVREGQVIRPLDDDAVVAALSRRPGHGRSRRSRSACSSPTSIPEHERQVSAIVERELPGCRSPSRTRSRRSGASTSAPRRRSPTPT